jgi:O-antigen/teichoic acid export membrane protein
MTLADQGGPPTVPDDDATLVETARPADAPLVGRRTGAAVLVAMGLGNAANYGFHVVTGRFLGAEAYGLLAGLVAIIGVVAVATASLQTATAKAIASRPEDAPRRPGWFDPFTRSTVVVGGAVSVLVLLASPVLADFFGIGVLPVALLAAYLVPAAIISIAVGRLQGLRRFTALAWFSAAVAVTKLVGGAAVVAVGLGVTTVIAFLVVHAAGSAAIGLHLTRHDAAVEGRVIDREVGSALVAFTLLWVMISADVPAARGLLSETDAGIYAAAAVVGKTVLWLPSVVVTIAFPRIATAVSANESTQDPMLRAFRLTLALCALGVGGLLIFGEVIFAVFFGEEYRAAAELAWKISVAAIPLAVANLLLHHQLARSHTRFIWVLAGAVALELAAFVLVPRTSTSIVFVLLGAGTVTMLGLMPAGGWRWLRSARRRGAATVG